LGELEVCIATSRVVLPVSQSEITLWSLTDETTVTFQSGCVC